MQAVMSTPNVDNHWTRPANLYSASMVNVSSERK